VGIHRLLYSSFCCLNTNTAITRQLIRTAKTLEAECWQVCGESWIRGQWVKCWARLGYWISLCYGPFSLGARFETYEPFISLIFQFFLSGLSQPRILRSTCNVTLLNVFNFSVCDSHLKHFILRTFLQNCFSWNQ
jgi:hypothetical protein